MRNMHRGILSCKSRHQPDIRWTQKVNCPKVHWGFLLAVLELQELPQTTRRVTKTVGISRHAEGNREHASQAERGSAKTETGVWSAADDPAELSLQRAVPSFASSRLKTQKEYQPQDSQPSKGQVCGGRLRLTHFLYQIYSGSLNSYPKLTHILFYGIRLLWKYQLISLSTSDMSDMSDSSTSIFSWPSSSCRVSMLSFSSTRFLMCLRQSLSKFLFLPPFGFCTRKYFSSYSLWSFLLGVIITTLLEYLSTSIACFIVSCCLGSQNFLFSIGKCYDSLSLLSTKSVTSGLKLV